MLCLVVNCVWLCNPLDCSPQDSSVHGISQARLLEWVTIFFSRESSQPRNRTHICVSCIAGRFFTQEAIREVWNFTYQLHCIYTVLVCKWYVNSCQRDKFKFWFLKFSGFFFSRLLSVVAWIHGCRIRGYRETTTLVQEIAERLGLTSWLQRHRKDWVRDCTQALLLV